MDNSASYTHTHKTYCCCGFHSTLSIHTYITNCDCSYIHRQLIGKMQTNSSRVPSLLLSDVLSHPWSLIQVLLLLYLHRLISLMSSPLLSQLHHVPFLYRFQNCPKDFSYLFSSHLNHLLTSVCSSKDKYCISIL